MVVFVTKQVQRHKYGLVDDFAKVGRDTQQRQTSKLVKSRGMDLIVVVVVVENKQIG
jgi:hypothetical protein